MPARRKFWIATSEVARQRPRLLRGEIFLLSFFIASAIFLFSPKEVLAQVVINEFVPNATPEWVEFYNAGPSVDLANYYFDDDNVLIVDGVVQKGTSDPGSDPIQLSGILSPGNTCFLELTSYLNNDTDTPSLFLNDGSLIDSYQYTSTEPDKSFARVPDGRSWQASQTPSKSPNKCSNLAPSPTPTPSTTSSPSLSPTPTSYPSGIILSEFMPNPDDGNEWVELKNTSSSEAVLTDWKIDDIADSGGSPKKFSATITAGSYYKIDLGTGFLNNDGDEVRLLYPDESLVDKTSYSDSNKGVSWIKTNATWCEAENPTPGGVNSSCRSQPTSPTPTPTPSPTPSPTLKAVEMAATLGGEILGEESSPGGIYLLESPSPSPEVLGEKTSKSQILAKIFMTAGLICLFFSACWLWYTRLRVADKKKKEEFPI